MTTEPPVNDSTNTVIDLSRGGKLVLTSTGPVQFGIPPETIKDTMTRDCGVPDTFVAIEPLFIHETGISFCELEFPIYYNFYIKRKKITVICTEEVKERVQTFIEEAAFGPQSLNIRSEYIGGLSNPNVPDLMAEMAFFRKNPFNNGEQTKLSDLVDFKTFEKGTVKVNDAVSISFQNSTNSYIVSDNGKDIAEVPLGQSPARSVKGKTEPKPSDSPDKPFYPPLFGVTVIGSGHGFDPTADTSGFILWVNHRGIIVDPPVGSTEWLSARNVTRKHVNALILTHCHADHDAGTLQKLFQEQKIPIYTSRTIMNSFVRKASAITGLSEERVTSLIDFHPIMMGPPIRINGAEFRFNYTLHSIPAIGMECYFLGKSFVYSGDTLNSPQHIESLHEEGVLPDGRKDSLLNFPWHHNVVFHEAGVPPLHTPVDRLNQLPASVKKRLYLLHTARSSVPEDSGLKVAEPGIEKTIEIHVEKNPHSRAVELLTVLNSVELFRNFPLHRAADFLSIAKVENFEAGELILAEGDPGTKFYLIVSGSAEVKRDGTLLGTYGPNDYFGETAVVIDIPRTADVFAKTSLQCIAIERADLLYFIRGSDVAMKLRRLFINRQLGLGDILENTEPFTELTPTQRTYLESYMDSDFSMAGHFFAKEGDIAQKAFILAEGDVTIKKEGHNIVRLSKNTFIADVDALLSGGKQTFSAEAMSNSRLFMLSKEALLDFLDLNPGFYFKLTEYDG